MILQIALWMAAGFLMYQMLRRLVYRPVEIITGWTLRHLMHFPGIHGDGDYLGRDVLPMLPLYHPQCSCPQGSPRTTAATAQMTLGRRRQELTNLLTGRYPYVSHEILVDALADDNAVRKLPLTVEAWAAEVAAASGRERGRTLGLPDDVSSYFYTTDLLEDTICQMAGSTLMADVASAWSCYPEAQESPLVFKALGSALVSKERRLHIWYKRYLVAAEMTLGLRHDVPQQEMTLAKAVQQASIDNGETWAIIRIRAADI